MSFRYSCEGDANVMCGSGLEHASLSPCSFDRLNSTYAMPPNLNESSDRYISDLSLGITWNFESCDAWALATWHDIATFPSIRPDSYPDDHFPQLAKAFLGNWNDERNARAEYYTSSELISDGWSDDSAVGELETSPSVASSTPPITDSIVRSSNSVFRESVGFFSADTSKPFVCPVEGCGRRYKFKGDLKVHATRNHKDIAGLADTIAPPRSSRTDKPYPCPVEECACGYKTKKDLKRHIKVKHSDLLQHEPDEFAPTPSHLLTPNSPRQRARRRASAGVSRYAQQEESVSDTSH